LTDTELVKDITHTESLNRAVITKRERSIERSPLISNKNS